MVGSEKLKMIRQVKAGIAKIRHAEFLKSVITLVTGTTIAQVIPFLVAPVLTRLYLPEDFGLLALFLSVAGFLSIISTLQYESAILLPKDEIDAINLVALCLIITLLVTFLSFIIVLFFNKIITVWIGNIYISFWLYFVPIPVFLTGVFNTFKIGRAHV